MNEQYLQYIREEIMLATADFSGRTKGQLVALVEQLQYTNERFPRVRQFVIDPETQKKIMLKNPPIPGKQSHAKGHSIPQVIPVEYSTASWRRAISSLEEHQTSWLLWSYGEKTKWEYQEKIVKWAWAKFGKTIVGNRIAKKTTERLRQLIWLAAQSIKAESINGSLPPAKWLADLAGVNKTNWSQNYAGHWDAMIAIYRELDRTALLQVSRSRSQQKAANFQQGIAEMN